MISPLKAYLLYIVLIQQAFAIRIPKLYETGVRIFVSVKDVSLCILRNNIFNPFKNCRLLLQHCNSTARSGVITLSQPLSVCPLSSLSMATLFHIRLINQIKLLKEHGPENSSLVSNLIPSATDNVSQKKGIHPRGHPKIC